MEVELQRLALAAGQRQLVMLALVVDRALAGDDLAHDLDVLAGAAPGLRVGHAVPALGDLRAGGAEAEDEAPAGELVDRRPAIAAAAGGRAGTCMIAAPSLIVFVCGASQASTLTTSEP